MLPEQIVENIKRIRYNIGEAKVKYNRESDDIQLMAVTKTVSPELVNVAIDDGVTLLGENRVQEFLEKKDIYRKNAQVHFIGTLQTNKVKYIIGEVAMIHSVNSLKLATEINRLSEKNGIVTDILIEVNIGDEQSKSGIDKNILDDMTAQINELSNIKICGLMAIPPAVDSEKYFERMQILYNDMKCTYPDMNYLSMGMSGDYLSAIKYGSNIVRIGSGIFGARSYTI